MITVRSAWRMRRVSIRKAAGEDGPFCARSVRRPGDRGYARCHYFAAAKEEDGKFCTCAMILSIIMLYFSFL